MSDEEGNEGYHDVFERIDSFDICPNSPGNMVHLAKAGFFYAPGEDFLFSVTCFGCSKAVNVWSKGDIPSHQKFHEIGCSFVKQTDGSQEKIRLSGCVFVFTDKTLGQYGNVFEGEMTSETGPHPCAIKLSRRTEQHLREEKVLRKLGSHHNVISLLECGNIEDCFTDHHFLVLEKCHKLNLCQYLSSHKESVPVYDVNWRMNFCKQLLNGVEFIHSKLIIHKDLKPSNILLSCDLSTIKIADFGISEEVDSSTSAIYCPCVFGTMGYRPPESFGRAYISMKSDIYSLGVVIFFLLSNGKLPFAQEFWDLSMQNGIVKFQELPLPNPESTQHLLICMLSYNRLYRPSIQEVKEHPFWTGTEQVCEFEYFCQEDLPGEIPEEDTDDELLQKKKKETAAKVIVGNKDTGNLRLNDSLTDVIAIRTKEGNDELPQNSTHSSDLASHSESSWQDEACCISELLVPAKVY